MANEAGDNFNLTDALLGANTERALSDMHLRDYLSAQEAIDTVDLSLKQVGELRTHVGALLNGLEHQVHAQSMYVTRLSEARQRIQDLDIASEMTQLMRDQVAMASTGMLSKMTRLNSEVILKLLMG